MKTLKLSALNPVRVSAELTEKGHDKKTEDRVAVRRQRIIQDGDDVQDRDNGGGLTVPMLNRIKDANPRSLERAYDEVLRVGDADNARFALKLILK